MSKGETSTAATEKPKRKRAAPKDRVMYFVTESKIEGSVHVVKSGETLVDLMDRANEEGKTFHYRKVTIPAGR